MADVGAGPAPPLTWVSAVRVPPEVTVAQEVLLFSLVDVATGAPIQPTGAHIRILTALLICAHRADPVFVGLLAQFGYRLVWPDQGVRPPPEQ